MVFLLRNITHMLLHMIVLLLQTNHMWQLFCVISNVATCEFSVAKYNAYVATYDFYVAKYNTYVATYDCLVVTDKSHVATFLCLYHMLQ